MAIAIGACNDNVATNAVGGIPDVSGQWSYSATGLTGAVNYTCSIQGATLSLTQTGDTLTGSVSGGTLSCQNPNGVTIVPLSGGAITNSGIRGDTLQINFGNPNFKNIGTVSGNSMSGQVEARLVLGTTAQLLGKFSASRP